MSRQRRGHAFLLVALALTGGLGHLPTAAGSVLPNQVVPPRSISDFNEHIFRRKVSSALAAVSRILDNTRSPRLNLDHEDHSYDDKFSLAEFLTNIALAASLNALDRLGLDESKLSELKSAVDQHQSVTLRFSATETCRFVDEKEVEIEGRQYETYETTEKGDIIEEKKATRSRVVNKVKEYHWSFGVDYELIAYIGNDNANKMLLKGRSGSTEFAISGNKNRPRPEVYTLPSREVDITWYLKQLHLGGDDDAQNTCQFSIDRGTEDCLTPRRNSAVIDAEKFFMSLRQWSDGVSSYFTRELRSRLLMTVGRGKYSSEQTHDLIRVESMKDTLFIPVLPLFQPTDEGEVNKTKSLSPLLSSADTTLFLNEQCRSIDAKFVELLDTFPTANEGTLVSSEEAGLTLVAKHCSSICEFFCDGIASIEGMLRSQLTRAVGKEISTSDFDEFLRFYYGKLFKEPYVPEPFVYSVRRPDHYPDGTLSIEAKDAGAGLPVPIVTTTRKIEDSTPMYLPISAATTIEIKGDRYLHAWVRHDFGGSSYNSGVNLVARARQFSSFMLVIGTISGPGGFNTQDAIILQNKDEILIPLLMEQLPTPKEFKDAIESLSPEQQRFAKAFRDMQLSTSVFGILTIQLKPQLEAVLGLPHDSLTKEIRLTQDLLSLFVKYQIPSDLLSFDGNEDTSVAEKINAVRSHVTSLQEMIEDAKKSELEEEKRKADMAKRQRLEEDVMEAEEDVVERGYVKAMGRRLNRADAVPLTEHARPQMMMAASVVADEMVSTSGIQEFGEMRMMAAQGVPEEATHLRAQKDVHRTSAKTLTTEQGKPPGTVPASSPGHGNAFDFTQVPKQLDQSFEELDDAAALEPTKIRTGDAWTKKYHATLLTPQATKSLGKDEQKEEKHQALDLLDALCKSGALPLQYTDLHVMVAATHSFDKSIVDTVIQDNTNPIEKMEKSLLIVSSTINDLPVTELVSEGRAELLGHHSPALLEFKKDEGEARTTE